MAEAALLSIAQAVLKQLGSKAIEEGALLWGMGGEIQKLTRTLSSIQAVLLDAEEKSYSPDNHQLRLWLKELRQAVYDAEDVLDDFSIEVQRRRQGKAATVGEKISKEVRSFFSKENQIGVGLKIVHTIRAIRARLDDINKRRGKFKLEVRSVEESSSMARKLREQTHSYVRPETVVGREHDKERVLEQLFMKQPYSRNDVVSIVGMGGLGKTTLAQLVYNDERVDSHFDVKAWVCVSDNFDVKLIVEKIIESCTGRKPESGLAMDTLRKRLHEHVNGKKYLILLDDVWNEDVELWSRLKCLLEGGAEGSRVMITTRQLKVAKLAAATTTRGVEPYELKGLDESMSWSLFRDKAFKGGEATSKMHESIGRQILNKCKGFPLAINTVAAALSFEESESDWAAFESKEMMWEMNKNDKDSGIMPTLKLSYDHLPTHLKHCFSYCRLFPKDQEMNVETLIHLWVAQGFVQSSDPSNRFDVGHGYYKDLLWRSFFQEEEKKSRFVTCKMHDLMHDLAIATAGEEINADLAVSNLEDLQGFIDSRLRVTRHVSLDLSGCEAEILSSIMNKGEANKVLRTLLRTYKPRGIYIPEPIIFSKTTSMRALDLGRLGMPMVSHTVHRLKHLKYLDLSDNEMKAVPEEITELVNLEVLKLDECRELEQLPEGIGKLSCLYHLGVDGCRSLTCMPRGIGQLRHLRELKRLALAIEGSAGSAQAAGIGELRYLNNLRGSLSITNLREVVNPSDGELADLRKKKYLERLELGWETTWRCDLPDEEGEGKLLEALQPHPNLKKLSVNHNHGPESPSWMPSMINLVELEINGCPNWKRLPPLDQLPLLTKLELRGMGSLEYIEYSTEVTSSSSTCYFFPSLESLILAGCPNLKGWLPTPAAEAVLLRGFPCVSKVEMAACGSITSMPYFPLELQTLVIERGSTELWKQILKLPPPSSSSDPQPQPRLSELSIYEVPDLDTLPEEILLRLSSSSLERLSIRDCPELTTLSPAMPHHFTSLQFLEISSCEKLDLVCDDEMQQQQQLLLPKLLWVYFTRIPKLTRLPDWLQLAPELSVIKTFDNCPIACIPEWLPKLVRLRDLSIHSYGKSARQCVDEDWPKIGHISRDISINNVDIKINGYTWPLNEVQAAEEENGKEIRLAEDEEEDEETCTLLRRFIIKVCGIFGRCFPV